MRGSNLYGCHLEGANFCEAYLEGARIHNAFIQGAKFHCAAVDGVTLIKGCHIDSETDFTGVGLDSARVEPRLRVALKNNIRRMHWKKWLTEGNRASRALKKIFVRPFWWMTGYGSSTAAVIYWFLSLAIIFGVAYFVLDYNGSNVIKDLRVEGMPKGHTFLRAMYFSVVTMTTLGFGDMHALKSSYWGHVLLTLQVVLGYVILGALVTRLGIVFTGEAPAVAATPAKEKVKEDD
jgi:hypothetical protein